MVYNPPHMNQTLADLKEDLEALARLAESCGARVWQFRAALDEHPFVRAEGMALWEETRALSRRLADEMAQADGWKSEEADALMALKRESAELLRVLQGKLGYVLAALDWQSPTFLHSLRHQAGKQVGRIVGTQNDYKRDMHLDAFAYEAAWRFAYVDAPLRIPPTAYVTSSGMAAMTTVVGELQYVHKIEGPVLCGRGSYFENRWILERAFPNRVRLVDDMDTKAMLEEMARSKPAAVFLDTLCNTHDVAVPDLPTLIPALSRLLGPRGFLVLDNSGLASSFQPFDHLPRLLAPRLFVIESLNKFHQFGFDRVTGGIVWTQGGLETNLLWTREHLGTNMPDASVLSLPWPDRTLLDARLSRIGRNALRLAKRIDACAAKPGSPLSRAVYPGLPSHPAYAWTKDYPFQGAFLTLAFKQSHARVGFYKTLIARMISEAARRDIQLLAGTSFGLDTTRLYLTALHATSITTPFVRISAGTETDSEVEAIADLFESVLERV
ncbi:hypothetical protein A2501_02865 [Candidatus Uhrbacteria bacterium RIFOXYC12_FULL_57_11]|nr:MAG: hypothetical protein A2501_02865 [Candidatus Uhrbacteria bacterium RIFOXYC12_FULL_57_11]